MEMTNSPNDPFLYYSIIRFIYLQMLMQCVILKDHILLRYFVLNDHCNIVIACLSSVSLKLLSIIIQRIKSDCGRNIVKCLSV